MYKYFLFPSIKAANEFCRNRSELLCSQDLIQPEVVRSNHRETIAELREVAHEIPADAVNEPS